MSSNSSTRSIGLARALACAILAGSMHTASATPVNLNTWYTFGFGGAGTPLTSGAGFVLGTNPPDGNPVVAAPDAPWTFNLTNSATLTVVDLFLSLDQFEIFNFGLSLGLTSVPVQGEDCDSDISCALANPSFSVGTFLLDPGDYSISGRQVLGIAGAGVFQIAEAATVPEPSWMVLFGAGLVAFGLSRRLKQRA